MTTEEIGAYVMQELKQLDKVAFVRFASVYRNFRDLDEFKDELNELLQDERMIRAGASLDGGRGDNGGRGRRRVGGEIRVTPVVADGTRVLASFTAPAALTDETRERHEERPHC